jgi:chromosome segregation protein
MKIKRIEIIGFKSFVDRTVLNFEPGVTAILGPNGCGKSNVIDAIRWAMGEQNAKNLRGQAMEDVIFGGSAKRRPHGMAEVTMVFSNPQGVGTTEFNQYSEIMITRRLYRNGDSEYLLNKTACRLKDISELFMDTGVGARAYSIIEQGKIGSILHSRPEERRVLIEEAAGVTKYKARRKAALRKIESTRQNLTRLNDVIAEVKRQRDSLRRQAGKAQRFRELRNQVKELEIQLARFRWSELEEQLEHLEGQLGRAETGLDNHQTLVATSELAFEKARLEQAEHDENVRKLRDQLFQLDSDIQKVESQLELLRQQQIHSAQQQETLGREIDEFKERESASASEVTLLQQQCSDAREDVNRLQQERERVHSAVQQDVDAEREMTLRIEQCRKQVMALHVELSRQQGQKSQAEQKQQALRERQERQRRDRLHLEEQRQQLQDQVVDIEEAAHSTADCLAESREQLEAVTLQCEHYQRQRDTLLPLLQTIQRQFHQCESRLESLQEIEGSRQGYEEGTRAALERAELTAQIVGTVADGLQVKAGYEAAVASALGAQVQAVQLRESETVLGVSGDDNFRRCRFQLPRQFQSIDFDEGVPLSTVVTLLPAAEPFAGLLAGVFVVDALANYCERALPVGCCLVTMAGDVLTWSGALIVGSGDSGERQLLDNKRRIEELQCERAELKGQLVALERQQQENDHLAEEAREQLQELTLICQRHQMQAAEHEKERSRVVRELERLEERLEVLLFDVDQFSEEDEQLRTLQQDLDVQIAATMEKQRQLNDALAQDEAKLAVQREQLSQRQQGLSDVDVKLARLLERQQRLDTDLLREQNAIAESRQRQQDRQQKLVRCAEERVTLEQQQQQSQTRVQVLLERRQREQQHQVETDERTQQLHQKVEQLDREAREHRASLNQLNEQHGHLQLKVREHRLELEHLHQTIRDKYQVDLTRQDDLDPQQVQHASEKLHKLRVRLEAFGEVNLMAIEEFSALEERYDFLERQRDDVHASIDDLQTAISRINRTTRKRFKEAFELVNEQFKAVFPRLFVGGEAELRLTDDSDLLESGIEIIAQPPGKKLQNVGLLSGGEKALTAVALIFAIFLIKPSPFCVLDEVDAPLDDANIGRFNEMIKEMSHSSQFVVITHNTRTMEIADTLFGVTMEEPGVSSLVAVRMEELAAV